MALSVVVLAAGHGTRMCSRVPKVLHPLGGRPLLDHVLEEARTLEPAAIHVVVGYGADEVVECCAAPDVHWVEQSRQLGSGHAVAAALPDIPADHTVVVLYGDVPLVTQATLERLVQAAGEQGPALLTVTLDDPTGYGRILRGEDGAVEGVVESRDASEAQLAVREVNTGLLAAPAGALARWLERTDNDNAKGEYYLTDIIELAVRDGLTVQTVAAVDAAEVAGVNDRMQLAAVERSLQRRRARAAMAEGATLIDPERFDVRGSLTTGRDVLIDVNVVFEGEVVLGDEVSVGAHCYLKDCRLGAGTQVLPNTVMEGAVTGEHVQIGPFARLRPTTELAAGSRVGNFVETKASRIGEASKINHLSYIGDTEMGAHVNIGAGTIVCNFDGVHKHRTVIGDEAFVGSGTELVAPVTIGRGATIGAGSTISKDCPEDELSIARTRQKTIPGWRRPDRDEHG